MAPFTVRIYLTTLRTFFTMAVDDVLPFSNLLWWSAAAFRWLRVQFQYRFTHPSRSSSSPWNGLCLPPPSSVDVLSDNELKLILKGQRNSNTERKTKSDLNVWYNWCRSIGEARPTEDGHQLSWTSRPFLSVKKRDGSSYEPDSLTSLHRSLERQLRDNLGKQYSILQDCKFALSREAIACSIKKRVEEGKGNKPNASEPFESEDSERLWESGALGEGDPETLQNSVWPKMWSNPLHPERCPIWIFHCFLRKQPTDMCNNDSPFYLTTNPKLASSGV